jgi:energy-coupling factor transport system substrate-specific component
MHPEDQVAAPPAHRVPENDGARAGTVTAVQEIFLLWGNTRLVVLTAISASLYAAILIPFKVLPIIPGVTEFRPANAIPVVCSFLFGPAGAWGAAIGNVIGDFFGGMGPGDLFGFLGNFFYGFIPYKAWEALTDEDPVPHSLRTWIKFVAVVLLASAACALTIGWGINLLGFVPFSVLANIILVNNFVVAVILTPFLLAVLHPRLKRGRLLYRDIAPARPRRSRTTRRFGLALVATATFGGLILGNLISTGAWVVPGLTAGGASATGALEVGVGLLPVILLLLLATALL